VNYLKNEKIQYLHQNLLLMKKEKIANDFTSYLRKEVISKTKENYIIYGDIQDLNQSLPQEKIFQQNLNQLLEQEEIINNDIAMIQSQLIYYMKLNQFLEDEKMEIFNSFIHTTGMYKKDMISMLEKYDHLNDGLFISSKELYKNLENIKKEYFDSILQDLNLINLDNKDQIYYQIKEYNLKSWKDRVIRILK